MPKFEYRASIEDAMSWELRKESLNQALIDGAEAAARKRYGPGFDDLDVDTSITVDGSDFLITFAWREGDLPATRRVRVSFNIITHRSGTAELDVPLEADVATILNDHLNKYGTNLVEKGLPEDLKIHQWDVQEPGDHTIETDWVEDIDPSEENT